MARRIILIGLVLIILIGGFAYFVGGVSATSPPIKKYGYTGTVGQFERKFNHYVSLHSDLKCEFSRRDSMRYDDGSRDLIIELTRNGNAIEYSLVCDNDSDKVVSAELKLVEAYNKTTIKGGYSSKADGVNELVAYLENNILNQFQKDEHVIINPKKEDFFDQLHIY
ncbi:MAG: hypothetical protein JO080_03000 [Mucilaginibacter sp.]|nr:hypothetical protein [Mucilaginibacter sp.]